MIDMINFVINQNNNLEYIFFENNYTLDVVVTYDT